MMVLGVPTEVKTFFAKPVRSCAKPIRGALAAMVLAFLLAPNRRCLKTMAGSVLGHRRHVATISRRLVSRQWKARLVHNAVRGRSTATSGGRSRASVGNGS